MALSSPVLQLSIDTAKPEPDIPVPECKRETQLELSGAFITQDHKDEQHDREATETSISGS